LWVGSNAGSQTFMDQVVDRRPGKAADFEQIATFRQTACEVVNLLLAESEVVDSHAPGARLGHDTVEGHNDNARIASCLDGTVPCVRGSCVGDDGVIALQNQVLDLCGLSRHFLVSGGEGMHGSDNAVSNSLLGDLVPALQHGLTPG